MGPGVRFVVCLLVHYAATKECELDSDYSYFAVGVVRSIIHRFSNRDHFELLEGHKSSGWPHCCGLACVPVPEINVLFEKKSWVTLRISTAGVRCTVLACRFELP